MNDVAFDFSGRIVLVSGALGALGRPIVTSLLAAGASVVALDLTEPEQARTVLPTSHRLLYCQADSAEPTAVESALDACVLEFSRLPDVTCCHAGIVEAHPIHQFPLDAFDNHLRVNLRGAFVLARAISARWVAASAPGHLIFTTSWVQDVPWPEIAPYNATKAAVQALSRNFARELADHHIRSNCVAPGMVADGLALRQWNEEPQYRARAQRAIPLGYMQPPQSVVNAFMFLISSLADYATGSTVLVDGGASLYPMDVI